MATCIEVLNGIRDLLASRLSETGVPTTVHLTKDDETALSSGSMDELGEELYKEVRTKGIRVAMPRIYGMNIAWDATERSIT